MGRESCRIVNNHDVTPDAVYRDADWAAGLQTELAALDKRRNNLRH